MPAVAPLDSATRERLFYHPPLPESKVVLCRRRKLSKPFPRRSSSFVAARVPHEECLRRAAWSRALEPASGSILCTTLRVSASCRSIWRLEKLLGEAADKKHEYPVVMRARECLLDVSGALLAAASPTSRPLPCLGLLMAGRSSQRLLARPRRCIL